MKKITASILTTLLMLSMVFSSSVFAANEEVSAWDSFLGLFSGNATTTATDAVGVEYRGHIQNVGNFPLDGTWIQGPNQLGTVGQSLRLEGFWIQLTNQPENVNIQYRVHVQNEGWMTPVENGAFAGTEGKSQQIEAIEINLVDDEGNAVQGYSVQYKGHIQNQGDTAWFEDGQQLGTVGSFLRLEALEVKIVTEKADMTAYNAAVAEATALTEADYTAASWAALETALIDNLVTEDNTQAEVDAATAAINAAIDALVMVTNVTGVSATDAKTLTVTFNQAISAADQALTTFTVKKGTTPVTLTATWAADGKSAALAKSTNLIAGTYTVTVGGITLGTNTATTEVVAQAAKSAEILTENVQKAANQQVIYAVYDQYGKELATNSDQFVWTAVNTNSGAVIPAVGGAVKYVDLDASAATLGDVIRLTGVYKTDATIVATKNITVSNIYTASFDLGEVVLPEGTTRLTQGVAWYEVSYTAADNFGNPVVLADQASDTFTTTVSGIKLITSDNTIVSHYKVADGVLSIQVENKAGNVTLTALNTNTSTVDSLPITVNATAALTSAEFGEFKAQEIIAGDANGTAKLGVTFFDQYGEEVSNKTAAFGTGAGGPLVVSVVPAAGLTVTQTTSADGYITFNDSAATAGTYTITLTNGTTGVSTSTQVTVNEARVPNELNVVTVPQSKLIVGGDATVKFEILDQYGDKMTADNAAYSVVVTKESAANVILTAPANNAVMEISAAVANSVITGGAAGTDTVTYTLQKDAGPVAIDSESFTMTVIADALDFGVTTDKAEYTAGEDIAVTVKAENPNDVVYTKYSETKTATVTVGAKDYIRTLTFVNGVATTTVPATTAGAALAIDVLIDATTYSATDVKVVTAVASKFVLAGTTGAATLTPTLTDAYGNTIDTYDGNKVIKVTYPAAADITGSGIDAEGNVVKTFTDGVGAAITFGANLPAGTYTVTDGTYTGTLTLV